MALSAMSGKPPLDDEMIASKAATERLEQRTTHGEEAYQKFRSAQRAYINIMSDLDRQRRDLKREINERNRAERKLQKLNEELEAFAYSVSHDLRAPLRRMDGFSRLLLRSQADKLDEEGKHYLERVCAGAQQMGELIDGLLDLSRIRRLELKRGHVDLHKLALQVAEDLQKSEPDRDVEFVLQKGITARGDKQLLQLAFGELGWQCVEVYGP